MSGRLKRLVSTVRQTLSFGALNTIAETSMMANGIFAPCGRRVAEKLGRKPFSASPLQSFQGPSKGSQFAAPHLSSKPRMVVLGSSRQQPPKSTPGQGKPARSLKAAQPQGQQQQRTNDQADELLQSASSMRVPPASRTPQPLASTSAGGSAALLTGTIQRITYRSEDTGYTVAKMQVDSSSIKLHGRQFNKNLVTVTGSFPEMSVGQQWQCEGNWVKHTAYGHQLDTQVAKEVRPTDTDSLISYLCGGATKGVGPVTARNMVELYGDSILNVLDSSDAVAQLTKVPGIGKATASKIKSHWELRRGTAVTAARRICVHCHESNLHSL